MLQSKFKVRKETTKGVHNTGPIIPVQNEERVKSP